MAMPRLSLLRPERRAELALLTVAAAWGLTFPLIREAVAEVSPFHFLALRFSAATLAFVPVLLLARPSRGALRRDAPAGLLLGAVAFLSYVTQTIGLQTIGAGRAAFITGLAVILVPLLAPLFGERRPGARALGAALLAAGGLYLLTEPERGGLTTGDLWVLACAFTYAVYTLLLQRLTEPAPGRPARDPAALAFFQILALALASLATLPLAPGALPPWSPALARAVVYCALGATVLTFLLQTRYQRDTTASRAALIFSGEPVFAALFAYALLGERLGASGLGGAAVVLLAIVIGQAAPEPRPALRGES